MSFLGFAIEGFSFFMEAIFIGLYASGSRARLAAASLVAGFGFLTIAEAGWAHALGVLALLGFLVFGFLAAAPSQLAAADHEHGAP
jgi:predicted branched-subunit amino acid permease